MSVFILVPKNTSLQRYVQQALSGLRNADPSRMVRVRGEDVPFLLEQYAGKGRRVIGFTGEDLFLEAVLAGRVKETGIRKRIEWTDPAAAYGKPALCLLGPPGKKLSELNGKLTVYISAKYAKTAEKFLQTQEKPGKVFERVLVNGCVETGFAEGLADLVIDIVYTGKSMKQNGLEVYEVIQTSDFVVLGNQELPKPRMALKNVLKYSPPLEGRREKLRLDFNENIKGCSKRVLEALQNVTAEQVSAYPEYGAFKKKLANYLSREENEILLTNGSDEGIRIVMEAFLEEGDEILIPWPTYSLFEVYARVRGARIVKVPFGPDKSFPEEELLSGITERTKCVVLVNPNSPTGTQVPQGFIKKVLEKAPNTIVLVDEAYEAYLGKSMKNTINAYKNLVILQTFSKGFGLAGLRIGYVLANPFLIKLLEPVASPYSVSSLAIVAASAALEEPQWVSTYCAEVREGKKVLEAGLERMGIKRFPSQANFVLADFGNESRRICADLAERRILVREMKDPSLAGCLRITTGPTAEMKRLLSELEEIRNKKILLFDLDGTLVDVRNSYRKTIAATAEFFCGKTVSEEEIQALKERGGFNNDWDLTTELLKQKNAVIPREKIVKRFQEFYLNKFRENENWLLEPVILRELGKKFRLGIVTGRPKAEARYVLERFNVMNCFECLVCPEDIPEGNGKPDPAGIRMALKQMNGSEGIYVGDSLDDQEAAQNAGIQFLGVMPSGSESGTLRAQMEQNGTIRILNNINEIRQWVSA
ncbi:MAG: histidinol-phosphate transaminase [Candidatus Diapherotrites archaeon]|nr:histidinol-phosphate transaminase [Candidatus Diapherotrites archaeon]